MLLEAIHPEGRREVLTDATHYEQKWQITYTYKVPHLFPAGTIPIRVVADNTPNKHNPDPTAWVGWGSRDGGRNGAWVDDIAFPPPRSTKKSDGNAKHRRRSRRRATAALVLRVTLLSTARPELVDKPPRFAYGGRTSRQQAHGSTGSP